MKAFLILSGFLAFGLLSQGGAALAQPFPTGLSNPKPCNYNRCLGQCVKNRLRQNCHAFCRRCT